MFVTLLFCPVLLHLFIIGCFLSVFLYAFGGGGVNSTSLFSISCYLPPTLLYFGPMSCCVLWVVAAAAAVGGVIIAAIDIVIFNSRITSSFNCLGAI